MFTLFQSRRLLMIASGLCFTVLTIQLNATEYKRFRVDVLAFSNVGLVFKNKTVKSVGVAIEPRFALTNYLTLGLRAGASLHFNPLHNMAASAEVGPAASKTAALFRQSPPSFISQIQGTLDLYPLPEMFIRPYIGLGLGMANVSYFSGTYTVVDPNADGIVLYRYPVVDTKKTSAYFMLSPRVGVDVWHLRFNLVYNLAAHVNQSIPLGTIKYFDKTTNPPTLQQGRISSPKQFLSNITFEVIFYLGGGSKD